MTRKPALPDDQLADLVVKARDGDRVAFNRLVDRFQPEILRMVYYRVRPHAEAEDLTQDIFMKAFRNVGHLREPDRFKSWLYRIAVNRVRDFHRRQRLRSLFSSDSEFNEAVLPGKGDEQDDPEALSQVLKAEFWHQINLILRKLSRMEKEVFMLRFFDHLSISEIAGALKKSESTIKTHLYRALAKFKKDGRLRRMFAEVAS
jgi:RNA polymerase sigma-70 factor (ECF subfamily)